MVMEQDGKDTRSAIIVLNNYNSSLLTGEKVEKDDEYNPFEHRDMSNANSTLGSCANLLKSALGTGILAMPMAFKNSGFLVGSIGTLFVGVIITHCVHIYIRTSQEASRKMKVPILGYTETAEAVIKLGPPRLRKYASLARATCDYGMTVLCISVSCVYILFVATSFRSVINYELSVDWDVRYYIAVTVIPCIAFGEIRKMKHLVPFSAVANLCIVLTFAITLWYMFNGPMDISERPMFSSWEGLPLFFSTVIFAMDGINAVMPVENSMKKPQQLLNYPWALNWTYLIVVILHGVIGLFGYIRYGDEAEATITLNLPKDSFVANSAQILIGISVLFTFGLKFYAPMDIMWRRIKPNIPKDRHNISQIAFRAGCILVMGSIAAVVPKLDPFISLIGAVLTSFLSLFIPALIDTIFRYPDDLGFANWILIKNGLLMIVAVLSLITGAYFSLKSIILLYM